MDGKLEQRVTRGSHSKEFMMNQFSGRKLFDTVYVTANPYIERIDAEGVFHRIIKTYSDDGPNKKGPGRHPDHVTEVASQTNRIHRNKKLIIHYMQPHAPYLGREAESLRQTLYEKHGMEFFRNDQIMGSKTSGEDMYPNLTYALNEGYISQAELYKVYAENLRLVLNKVQELISELEGKTVITADYGETLGDIRGIFTNPSIRYEHYENLYSESLRIVPWFIIEHETRKDIISEPPRGVQTVSEEVIKNNLKSLGYID